MCACPLWSKFYMSGEWEILTLAQLEPVLASNVVPSVSRCLVTIVVNVPPSGGAPTAPTHSLPPWRIECRSPPRVTQIVTSPNDNEHVFGGCVSHSCPLHLHNVISILFAWINVSLCLPKLWLSVCVCMYFGLHCVCVCILGILSLHHRVVYLFVCTSVGWREGMRLLECNLRYGIFSTWGCRCLRSGMCAGRSHSVCVYLRD